MSMSSSIPPPLQYQAQLFDVLQDTKYVRRQTSPILLVRGFSGTWPVMSGAAASLYQQHDMFFPRPAVAVTKPILEASEITPHRAHCMFRIQSILVFLNTFPFFSHSEWLSQHGHYRMSHMDSSLPFANPKPIHQRYIAH